MGRGFFIFVLVAITFLCLPIITQAQQEQITLTTYYPSPSGVYNELTARRLVIGDDEMPNQDGIINFQGIELEDGDPEWANDGAIYYNSHTHRFRYFDGERWRTFGSAGGPVFDWEYVEVYDVKATAESGVVLVNIPDGSGVILGGSIAGFYFRNVIMNIDGENYRLPGMNPDDLTELVPHDADGVALHPKTDDKADDADQVMALPSNIRFQESLRITFDAYYGKDNRTKYGVVYIGRTDE